MPKLFDKLSKIWDTKYNPFNSSNVFSVLTKINDTSIKLFHNVMNIKDENLLTKFFISIPRVILGSLAIASFYIVSSMLIIISGVITAGIITGSMQTLLGLAKLVRYPFARLLKLPSRGSGLKDINKGVKKILLSLAASSMIGGGIAMMAFGFIPGFMLPLILIVSLPAILDTISYSDSKNKIDADTTEHKKENPDLKSKPSPNTKPGNSHKTLPTDHTSIDLIDQAKRLEQLDLTFNSETHSKPAAAPLAVPPPATKNKIN